jgi:hypothetical protein
MDSGLPSSWPIIYLKRKKTKTRPLATLLGSDNTEKIHLGWVFGV